MAKNLRAFRIDDEIWNQAVIQSKSDNSTVSEILRDSLSRYIRVSVSDLEKRGEGEYCLRH